ncbi:MAG: hypothetical protein COX62_04640 [Deltaproteobacteria bacterium CG_4_10_14_0_2_um_filter_43_8]|nr:MAG: hypothetical protein COV43_04495 [Deltaproteobacteria bacterium CG11_big_fil_rev_8_21_14_0_20_42_23]PJA20533.1 MAG: hypothetical protein COX62_04640 [Deltaproteobacteria bacterium CG_4_10_14_0_2_um_filter_43_8]PJC65034.1 MAG: hypothetical protein CO021_00885 [Deltaproteobacteria bacterium CG_4_9_14_0_2_um_filter_42_21]
MASFKELFGKVLDIAIPTMGEDVRYTSQVTGIPIDIKAVFDLKFEHVDPDTEMVISSNAPRIGVKLSDLPASPRKGDQVEILASGAKYLVHDSQEDGQGGASLFLHEVL